MKKIVCCISCAAIIGISVFYAGRLLQPNFTVDAFHAIESFHSMPENSFVSLPVAPAMYIKD